MSHRWMIAAALATLLTGCGKPAAPRPQPSTPPPTITVIGSLSLGAGDFSWDSDNGTCWGNGGYDDIRSGAPVTVTDPAGTVIAVGKLTLAGVKLVGDDLQPVALGTDGAHPVGCQIQFAVANVPAGKGFYGVEVTHRGSLKYSEADLGQPLTLKLG